MKRYVVYTCFALALIWACRKSGDNTPAGPTPFKIELPAHFPAPVYDLSQNPPTVQGIALGRRLFYDPGFRGTARSPAGSVTSSLPLSPISTIRSAMVSTTGRVSGPFHRSLTSSGSGILCGMGRQSPGYTAAYTHYRRQRDGEDLSRLISRLNADKKYRGLFDGAFGPGEINSQKLFRALSQFMATMNSYNAKYDSVINKKAQFTTEEARGMRYSRLNAPPAIKSRYLQMAPSAITAFPTIPP